MGSFATGARRAFLRASVTLLFIFLPWSATAQLVASEKSSVSQTVDGTVIKLEYSRPSLRGRVHVFGSEVPFDTLWTPGANWATTLEVNKNIEVSGAAVPAGTYTVWMAVRHGDWDVILDPRDKVFHVPHPARSDSQIVFTVKPDTTAPVLQTLQWSFPAVRATGADLRFHWERTAIDFDVRVQPSRVLTTTPEQAAPYVGRYLVESAPADSADSFSFELTLTHQDGYLGGDFAFPGQPPTRFLFAPLTDQVFSPVFTVNGTPAEVITDAFIEFALDAVGRGASFEARYGEEDTLWMTGRRIDDR